MGKQSEGGLVLRGIALSGEVRFAVGLSTPVTKVLLEAHQPSPHGLLAMSRAATAIGLLSTTIKGRQQIGIQVNGDGPLGELYALSNASGELRITAHNPIAETPNGGEIGTLIGEGRFTLIKTSDSGEPYRGTVPIFTGGIAEDLAFYFMHSEQLPTACGLGERIENDILVTGGYLIQTLPNTSPETIQLLERRVVNLAPMQDLLCGPSPLEDMLENLFQEDYEILGTGEMKFSCPCERTKYARTLLTLGKEELTQIRDEDGEMTLSCHFCAEHYHFNREEISALILGAR